MGTISRARYQCSSCGRPFDRKDALSRHMQLHDPDRAAAKIRRRSCTSCFRSKIKCSGTRPLCSSCEKRGVECRYLKDSASQQISTPEALVGQARRDAQTLPESSTLQSRHADNLLSESVSQVPGLSLAFPSQQASLIGPPLMPQNTDLGEANLCRRGYPDVGDVYGPGNSDSPDWLEAFSVDNHVFMEPPIRGLWDFFPMSPPQATQPFVYLPQHPRTPDAAVDDDGTDEASDALSEFEHPWPMNWNPGSIQPLSLPLLGDFQQFRSIAIRMSCGNPLTPSSIKVLKDWIKLYYGYGPWQQLDLENFPDCESLNHAIDMYFVHFHAILPMIHHPTFDPEKDTIVTLCLINIGVNYTAFPGAQSFSKSLFELIRRLLISRAERERRFVRTATYLTAQLLQAAFGYLGDDERVFEIAESCRSSLVYNAKCLGLFRRGNDLPDSKELDLSPEDTWHSWIRSERVRRIAWAIYELDTSCAYLHNNRPFLSPEDMKLSLPSSSQHWEAPSAHAWASLHPWATSCPPAGNLRDLIQDVVSSTAPGFSGVEDEKHRFLVVLSLVRTLWSLKDVHFASIIERHNEGFESALCTRQQEMLMTTIDDIYRPGELRSRLHTRPQRLQVVYRAQLTHIAHLFGAGDLLNFLYPYLRKGYKSADLQGRLREWAEKDSQRVRRVAYHSAQLLAIMRQFPSNLPAEPFVVFHAGVVLSMMSTQLSGCSANSQTRSLQIDLLDVDEQQVEQTQTWIKHGEPVSVWVHGVTSLSCEKGREQVLDQTALLLNRMSVWPIAKKFAAMIISLREDMTGGL